jgi:hypothetical protein
LQEGWSFLEGRRGERFVLSRVRISLCQAVFLQGGPHLDEEPLAANEEQGFVLRQAGKPLLFRF